MLINHIAILQIRIYALYNKNNKVLFAMLTGYAICIGLSTWSVVKAFRAVTGKINSNGYDAIRNVDFGR